jgi:hypothetical protein
MSSKAVVFRSVSTGELGGDLGHEQSVDWILLGFALQPVLYFGDHCKHMLLHNLALWDMNTPRLR